MRKISDNLHYKVFVSSLVLALIPLLILGCVSYSISSHIIKDKVSTSNLKTVEQTGNNIDFIFNDVMTTSIYLLQSNEVINTLSLNPASPSSTIEESKLLTQRYLAYLSITKDYIHSFYIKGYNGVSLDTANSQFEISKKRIKEVESLNGSHIWSTDPIIDYSSNKVNVFSISRVFSDIHDLKRKLGLLKINIGEKSISNTYSKDSSNLHSTFLIIDENHRIVSSTDKKNIGTPVDKSIISKALTASTQGYYTVSIKNKSFLITYYHLKATNWILINIVPLEELLKDNDIILNSTFIGILISLIICALFSYFFFLKVLSPLKQVRALMHELEHENYDIYMDVAGNDEISLLGKSFNKMSKRLKEVRNQVYLSKIKQREAELIALQSQINPHFLYNTLDTIYWTARMENAFESSKLVQALSVMFRLSLNSGNEFTTVEKELQHLKNYLIIQETRYKGLITFNINAAPDTMDCVVIKLILQPLVENAIYHGIEKKGSTGTIDINIYRQDSALIYEVIDDGVGADVDYLNKLLANGEEGDAGFAIKNVNDRIQLLSSPAFGLKFYNNSTQGTKVVVTQKFGYDKEVFKNAEDTTS